MATTIPQDIQGVNLPDPPDTQPHSFPQDLTSPDMTAFLLEEAKRNVTGTFIRKCDTTTAVPQRMIELRPRITRLGRTVPDINTSRPQACDAIWTYVYGTENTGTDMCTKCRNGKGLFEKCVSFTDMCCTNCNYSSEGHTCTKSSRSDITPRTTPVKTGRIAKKRRTGMSRDLQTRLSKVPSVHLRTMAEALESIADDVEEHESELDSEV